MWRSACQCDSYSEASLCSVTEAVIQGLRTLLWSLEIDVFFFSLTDQSIDCVYVTMLSQTPTHGN